MPTATVTSKGQVTLPAKMRDALGLVPGSKVEFEEQPNGDYLVRRRTIDICELRGILKDKINRVVTVEQMRDAIAAEAASRLDRCR